MTKPNILVICYSFPPNPGVGGRRLAKFSKCLANDEYNIHVISNFNTTDKTSEWINDVQSNKIINHTQNVFYPNVYVNGPKSFLEKIEYRFWLLFFKLFSSGSFYDRSFFWKKTILEKAKHIIIQNNITNVIVTGPPFRLLYYAALLKKELSHINLIIDFRDPWTDNSSFLGFNTLSKKRLDFEKRMEEYAIQHANYVISANDYLTQLFKNRYPNQLQKFKTVINGYDEDELSKIESISSNNFSKNINFVLAGTLYSDLEYVFIPFLDYLSILKITNEELFIKMNFHFYGQIDMKLQQVIASYNLSCIKIHGFQKLAFVKEKLAQADFCMMFTAPNHGSNFNTKFYEYIAIKKPIVHFSNDGEISTFISNNNLGYAIRPKTFNVDFEILLNAILTNTLKYNTSYNSKEFEVNTITKKVEELFI